MELTNTLKNKKNLSLKYNYVKVLGIEFINGSSNEVLEILKQGGVLVVPAAPSLLNIKKDKHYYECLLSADVAIPDSAYMTLLWNMLHKDKLKRISGLKFLKAFLSSEEIKKESSVLLVNPNDQEARINIHYLNNDGFKIGKESSYVAPWYNRKQVKDEELLALAEKTKPKHILINLAGGVQEKLAIYLRDNLSYCPAIICTGAAIAFLTGQQAHIPNWADKYYLGWFTRCLKDPRQFIPRYLKAVNLAFFILRYGEKSP